MQRVVQPETRRSPCCGSEQAAELVSMFSAAEYCIACDAWTSSSLWNRTPRELPAHVPPADRFIAPSAIRRPAVFVATEGADLFGRWAGVELNRELFGRRVTTLHCCDNWFDLGWQDKWFSRSVGGLDWRSQVRGAAAYADCVLLVGDLRDFGRLLGHDLEHKPPPEILTKLVIIRNRDTGLPARYSQYRLFNIRGRRSDEIKSVVEEVWKNYIGSSLVLPLPSKAILGAIVEPINFQLIQMIERRPTLLDELGWRDIEKLVAEVLAGLGHTVELQRGTKDGGVDIIAFRSGFTNDKLLVQVKHPRTGRFVGIEPVQRLHYIRNEQHATKGIIACTSGFTRGALDLIERYRWELEGRDRAGILRWVRDYLGA